MGRDLVRREHVAFWALALGAISCGQSGQAGDQGSPAGRGGAGAEGGTAGSSGAASGGAGGRGFSDLGGTAGASGSAGAPLCSDPDAARSDQNQIRTTTTGRDGEFTDECDAGGNLVEYLCETAPPPHLFCGQPNPNPGCTYHVQTGRVIARMLDCGGACREGTCETHCPDKGDELVYLRFDDATGSATFSNRTHDAEYTCALRVDWREGGYDCIVDPELGAVMTVTSASSCLDREAMLVQVGPATGLTECSYDCARTR